MLTRIQLQYVAAIALMLGTIFKENIVICINVCILFGRTEVMLCVI